MFTTEEAEEQRLERLAASLVANHRELLAALVRQRKDHDLSQDEVAKRMGVSQPAVSAFERYDANPTLSTLRRYALAVNARLTDIVSDDCETHPVDSRRERGARVAWIRSEPEATWRVKAMREGERV